MAEPFKCSGNNTDNSLESSSKDSRRHFSNSRTSDPDITTLHQEEKTDGQGSMKSAVPLVNVHASGASCDNKMDAPDQPTNEQAMNDSPHIYKDTVFPDQGQSKIDVGNTPGAFYKQNDCGTTAPLPNKNNVNLLGETQTFNVSGSHRAFINCETSLDLQFIGALTTGDKSIAEKIIANGQTCLTGTPIGIPNGSTDRIVRIWSGLAMCCLFAKRNLCKLNEYLEIMKMLLSNNDCNVNLTDDHGQSALVYACILGLPECVELLLNDPRCDPCVRSKYSGQTSLLLCCCKTKENPVDYVKYIQIIKMLLMHEHSGINVADKNGRNELMHACMHLSLECAELYLNDSKCDPCQQDKYGNTALIILCHEASQSDCTQYAISIQILQLLLQHDNCGTSLYNKDGMNALMLSCRLALPEFVEALVKHDQIDLTAQNRNGLTCLHFLFMAKNIEKQLKMLAILSKHKQFILCTEVSTCAQPPGTAKSKITKLHDDNKQSELLKNQNENDGNTLRRKERHKNTSSHRNYFEESKVLTDIQYLAPLETEKAFLDGSILAATKTSGRSSRTPSTITRVRSWLTVCCFNAMENPSSLDNILDKMKYLLSNDTCNVNLGDDEGRNALMYACAMGLPECVEILLDDPRCDPSLQDNRGQTSLLLCCCNFAHYPSRHDKYIHIMQMLLKHENSHINSRNIEGETALMHACMHLSLQCAELLLHDPKCDPCAQDEEGITALAHLCSAASNARHHLDRTEYMTSIKILRVLLKHEHCGITRSDKRGMNVLMLSCYLALPEFVETLVRHDRIDLTAQDYNGSTCLHIMFETEEIQTILPVLKILMTHTQFKFCLQKFDHYNFRAIDNLLSNANIFKSEFIICRGGLQILDAILFFDRRLIPTSKRSLALAILYAGLDTCHRLMEDGADINSVLPDNETVLHCALQNNSLQKLEYVLKHPLHCTNLLTFKWQNMTPYQMAISYECNSNILEAICQNVSWVELQQILLKTKSANETLLGYVQRLGVKSWISHFANENSLQFKSATSSNTVTLTTNSEKIVITKNAINSTLFKGIHNCDTSDCVLLIKHCQCLQKKYGTHFKAVAQCALKIAKNISKRFKDYDELAFMEFEPILSGSMMENTKCFYPNEVDIVCRWLYTEEKYKSRTSKRYWDCANNVHKELQSTSIYREFVNAVKTVFSAGLASNLVKEMPYLHIGQNPLRYDDKILRFVFLYNKQPFSNLEVSVDLAPVFRAQSLSVEHQLPLHVSSKEFTPLIKVSRHYYKDTTFPSSFQSTHSDAEHEVMLKQPEYVRDGYITAKAMRLRTICEPGLDKHEFGLLEPIDIQSIVSSYILKNCLYNLLIKIEKGVHKEPISCRFAWADEIYRELENSLTLRRKVCAWYPEDNILLGCYSDHPLNQFVCCQKIKLILALTKKIRSWLAANMLALRYQRHRPRSTYKKSIINATLKKI